MAKGQRLKPEQIVTLLRQIDVLTTNGKTLAQACKEVGTVEQSYYRWRKIYGGMKVDQAKKYKDLELENTRLKELPTLITSGATTLSLSETRMVARSVCLPSSMSSAESASPSTALEGLDRSR